MPTINQKTVLIDNLITSTWYDVRAEVIDQVFKITPFYDRLVEKGRIRSRVPDGTHFEIPVRYAKQDANTKWFGRGDTFGLAEKETLTRLIYETKNLGTSIPRYWDDDRKNRGKAKLIDYAAEIVDNARDTLVDNLETDLLVQNADPLAMNALPTLISTTPTVGSIGGLTRTSNEYLQNNIKDFTGLTTGANLIDEMDRLYNLCSQWKGGGVSRTIDLIVTERRVYQDYERICRAMQTIVTNKTERASLGFGNLLFKNAELFWAPECPEKTMFMLNVGTLEFDYDPGAWFEMTPWKNVSGTSLDRVAQIVCVCNLICTHFRKNAVMFNITPTTN